MRKLLVLVVLVGLSACLLGCSSEADKGVNRDKDRPRPADKAAQ